MQLWNSLTKRKATFSQAFDEKCLYALTGHDSKGWSKTPVNFRVFSQIKFAEPNFGKQFTGYKSQNCNFIRFKQPLGIIRWKSKFSIRYVLIVSWSGVSKMKKTLWCFSIICAGHHKMTNRHFHQSHLWCSITCLNQ